jgi:hypothetical protein
MPCIAYAAFQFFFIGKVTGIEAALFAVPAPDMKKKPRRRAIKKVQVQTAYQPNVVVESACDALAFCCGGAKGLDKNPLFHGWEDDKSGHYRQSCNESNTKRRARDFTARRQGIKQQMIIC